MRGSSNPILSRPDAWQATDQNQAQAYGQQAPNQAYGQPYQGQPYQGQAYQAPGPGGQYPTDANAGQFAQQGGYAPVQGGRMTIDDVITKSAITIGVLTVVAALTFLAADNGLIPLTGLYVASMVAAFVAFGTVMLVSFRRKINPGFVLAYAAIEGVFIGGISYIYAINFGNTILPAAVLGTLVAAGATLAAYKFLRIKVTDKFRKMVMIGTMAYAGVLLVNFVLSFFGLSFINAGHLTVWALLASAVGVGLAVFNLILDFDYIERGIAMGAPASESWRGAFGLTVTMVWLYIEMLRLLSYFNRS